MKSTYFWNLLPFQHYIIYITEQQFFLKDIFTELRWSCPHSLNTILTYLFGCPFPQKTRASLLKETQFWSARFFYKHFYKQLQAEIGKKSSKS